jgi:hypothetical protein
MILNMYSIKDAKTGYMTPVLEQNDAAALRNFAHAVNQPDSIMHDCPNDFALFLVAKFDTERAVIFSYGDDIPDLPHLVADASEVLRNG